MNETVEVLEKYKSLVKVNDQHVLLKEKTMLQFLVYILDSPNKAEVGLALEVIQLMVDNPQNHQQLRAAGIVESLEKVPQSGISGKENAQTASKILAQLKKPGMPPIVRQTVPNHMYPSVIYVLNIPGLTNTTRRDIEYTVICLRGVISVVFDVTRERCTVRTLTKVTPAQIANSIHSKTGLAVRLVHKNNKGLEVFQDLVRPPMEEPAPKEDLYKSLNDSSITEDETDLPDYLPEEDPPVTTTAITSFAKLKTGAATFVKSASSFFSESFYW